MQEEDSIPDQEKASSTATGSPTGRNVGLDLGRLMAAFFVVAIHAGPRLEAPGFSAEIFNQASRFAVPFFFCVSGYLFAKSCRRDPSVRTLWRYERRVLSLHLFWSVVYFLNPSITAIHTVGWAASYRERWHALIADPVRLLFEGTALHLWFLVSLAIGLFIIWVVNRRGPLPGIIVGAVLFLAALLAGPYRGSGLPLDLGINPRDGPFFATLFIALGYLSARIHLQPDRRLAWICFLGGALLHGLEIVRMYLHYNASPFGFNYVLGTLFFGYGAFLLALTWRPSPRVARFAPLGTFATGIYCVHVLFVAKADFFDVFVPEPWWGFVRTALVFLLALLASLALAKIPLFKRFVT